jgi:hypothetical protein
VKKGETALQSADNPNCGFGPMACGTSHFQDRT